MDGTFIGIVAAIILGLIAVVWNLLNEKIRSIREECTARDDALWNQIGRDSFSGMRRIVHAEDGASALCMDLDRRMDKLEGKT